MRGSQMGRTWPASGSAVSESEVATLSIVIHNQHDQMVEVMLEPWGEIYPLDPNSLMRFVMENGDADMKGAAAWKSRLRARV